MKGIVNLIKRPLLVLAILLSSSLSLAYATNPSDLDACHESLKPIIEKQLGELNVRYKKIGDPIWHDRESRLLPGTNGRAIVIIGGFIASPRDFLELAAPLQKAGFTVYIPLISGFGGGWRVANASTPDDWRGSVIQALDTISSCFSDISIVGHSLGGAILTDLLLLHQDEIQAHLHNAKIASVSLLAPYYKPYYQGLDAAQQIIGERTDVVDLRILRLILDLAGDTHFALPIPPAESDDDDPYFPIVAGRTVLDYQAVFASDAIQTAAFHTPTYLVYSADDHVVDGSFSKDFANTHFKTLHSTFYHQGSGVTHYLNHPDENPYFAKLQIDLLKFIEKH